MNRYQVMTNQSWTSKDEVAELLRKTQRMMEANRCTKEIQHRMYPQLPRDLSMKEERKWQGRQEETEMTVRNHSRPRERKEMPSEWPYMPRGRNFDYIFPILPTISKFTIEKNI